MSTIDWCEQFWPEVVARAVLDTNFRRELAKDPRRTLKIAGIELKDEELEAIMKLDLDDWDEMTLNAVNDRIGQLAGYKVTRVVITE